MNRRASVSTACTPNFVVQQPRSLLLSQISSSHSRAHFGLCLVFATHPFTTDILFISPYKYMSVHGARLPPPNTSQSLPARAPASSCFPDSYLLFSNTPVTVVSIQDTLLASAPLLEAFAGLWFLTFIASGASCYELDASTNLRRSSELFEKCHEAHQLLMMWACTRACSALPVCSRIQ